MLRKLRNFFKLLVGWLVILLILGIVIEVVLQIRGAMRSSARAESGIVQHTANPFFGTWRTPNQRNAVWEGECFRADDININSYGMRAEEPNTSKKKRVGWFGDSMIQGYEVSKEEHFLYRLNAVDSKRDHLNFGIAATGTVTQLQNFIYHADSLQLDEAVLCLYLSNDVWNNSYNISITDGWELDKPVPFLRKRGSTYYLDRSRIENHISWFKSLYTVSLLRAIFQRIGTKLTYRSGFNPYSYTCPDVSATIDFNKQRFCASCAHPWWEEAHDITAYAIRQFKAECAARNIPLRVLLIPSQEELLSPDQVAERHPALAGLIDYSLENKWCTELLEGEGIPYLNLLPIAQKQVQAEGLEWPFYSLECDMHFAPAGHDLLFEAVRNWK